ncbi:MAG: TRAP transporter small permease [Pseudomonadota bacterium]
MYRAFERTADALAVTLALLGGVILIGIIVLTCISIVGRAFVPLDIGIGPIRGIYDMSEIGFAVAVFAFLPYSQMQQAHARVDLLKPAFGTLANRSLELVFNLGMLLIAAIGTWRLYLGMVDKMRFGETTLIAQIPVWYGFAACLPGALGFVFVAAFCVSRSTRALTAPREKAHSHVQH